MEVLVSLVVGAALIEAYAWLDPLAKWLVNRAARRLPEEHRDTFTRMFVADLDALPHSFAKIGFALYNCTMAIDQICDEIAREKLVFVADEFEPFIESMGEIFELLEKSKSLLQRSQIQQSLLMSVANYSFEKLQRQRALDAQSAIDHFRSLTAPAANKVSEFRSQLSQYHAILESFATSLREPLARTGEACRLIKLRVFDDRPITDGDVELLEVMILAVGDLEAAFDTHSKQKSLPDLSTGEMVIAIRAMVAAFQAASRAVRQGSAKPD